MELMKCERLNNNHKLMYYFSVIHTLLLLFVSEQQFFPLKHSNMKELLASENSIQTLKCMYRELLLQNCSLLLGRILNRKYRDIMGQQQGVGECGVKYRKLGGKKNVKCKSKSVRPEDITKTAGSAEPGSLYEP